ncbi:hypothetical protein INR49_015770 [Caranx melampygus]|nr:hypothetical protein INR49_015770 [Caranx melampygus]
MITKWVKMRKTESEMMMDIKNRADQLNLSFSHVTQSEGKGKAFGEFLKNKMTPQTIIDERSATLNEELASVLKDTLEGLKKLDCFLDAVERLAVTSCHVFTENQMLHLPDGISFKHVQDVIRAAQTGVSLALTMTGVGLGVASGVNGAVTTATGIGVNHKHQKKASEVFKLFMEDMQSLQDCLEVVINETVPRVETSTVSVAVGVGTVLVKLLKNEEMIAAAGKVLAQEGKALRNVPRVASDIPDIGQAAVKGPLALSNCTMFLISFS